MNGKKYLENQIPVFCIHLLGMCLLSLFLLAVGNTIHSVFPMDSSFWMFCFLLLSKKKKRVEFFDRASRTIRGMLFASRDYEGAKSS